MGDFTVVAILSVGAGIAVSVLGAISSRYAHKRIIKAHANTTAVAAYGYAAKQKVGSVEFGANEIGSSNSAPMELIGAER